MSGLLSVRRSIGTTCATCALIVVTVLLMTGHQRVKPALLGPVHAQPTQRIPVIPPPSSRTLDQFRSKIQHIVFLIKENRSFDNYFGTFPGAEGATSGVISTGERMTLNRTPDKMPRDL